MPFNRPTLTALKQQVAQDINADIPGADSLLRFSNLNVLGKVQAGLAHQHYGYLDYIALQATPYTATDEYLAAWGALKGVYQKAATQASGLVTFPAASALPTIAIGASVTRSDGIGYTVQSISSQTSAQITVDVLANPDLSGLTGAFGNCVSGTSFTLGQAVPGITSTGTSGIVAGGADLETEAAFSARVIDAYQQQPQGGASADYVAWALQYPGVTRAWTVPLYLGAGTVGVYFMMDLVEVAHAGVPQGTNGVATLETRATVATGDQLAVANYIYPLRPVTALVYLLAPTLTAVNFSIHGVALANRPTVQTALANQLLSAIAPGGIVELNSLWAAATSVDTTDDFLITVPSADIAMAAGALPVMGVITWS
jgi:uncharacterized phage protein gp47/JayE